MPDWTLTEAATGPSLPSGQDLAEQLVASEAKFSLLLESYTDLETLYREDVGWRTVGAEKSRFTPEGRKKIAAIADLMATGNALIKRAVALRTGYVWGQGVSVAIADDGSDGQDIGAVWAEFWDHPTNRRVLTSSEAQVRYERKLATSGEAFFAFPTDPLTGRVQVRRLAPNEIVDRVCDPEDAESVWLYKRVWSAVTTNPATGGKTSADRTTYYPALGFSPPARPKTYAGDEIRWDAPVRPVTVNCPDEDWRGIGDVFAAMPWSKVHKEFLEDFAVYMRALTRILGQATAKNPRMAARVRDSLAQTLGPDGAAGSFAVTDPGTSLSLVSKSGAQIDSGSHRPFATMVAAALEVPLTMLLGDPGVTGARATAETLDQPTELMAKLRREVHSELLRDIAGYVIDQAVIAPRGPLRGAVRRDLDRLVVTLPEGDSRAVEIDWPEFDSTPLKDLVAAIAEADSTEKLPQVEILKLLARAFGIEDLEGLIDAMTDDDGNWIDRATSAGDAAAQRFRNGEDPVSALDPQDS